MKRVLIGAIVAAALALPAAAVADSCANVSRAPAACGMQCDGPVIQGNWVWLPSIDSTLPPVWGFAPPGREDSVEIGLPGANGNYTDGQTSSLLGVSAYCAGGGNVQDVRQTDHGVQTGCE